MSPDNVAPRDNPRDNYPAVEFCRKTLIYASDVDPWFGEEVFGEEVKMFGEEVKMFGEEVRSDEVFFDFSRDEE